MVWARRSGICLNEFRVANFRFQIQRGCHVSIVDRTAFHASVGFLTTDVTDHTDESWRGLRPQPNLAALARTRPPPPNNALSGEFGYRRSRTLPAFWPPPTSRRRSPGLETRTPNRNAHWPPPASCRWCHVWQPQPGHVSDGGRCSLFTVRLRLPNPRSTGVKPAGPCWLAGGFILVAKPPVPRREAGGAVHVSKLNSPAASFEKSAEPKSSQKNHALNVC